MHDYQLLQRYRHLNVHSGPVTKNGKNNMFYHTLHVKIKLCVR